jgi:hypothetical protein
MGERATTQAVFDRLDAASRERELTQAESLLLERTIRLMERQRLPANLTRELARHGIKRDMRHFSGRSA